jgi:FkbM family methyltransferase
MKSNLILILIVSVLLFLSLLLIVNAIQKNIKSSFNNTDPDSILRSFNYFNEKGEKIDNFKDEIEEQKDALTYIDANDVVLELGARYGTVSVTIAHKQNNNGNLVVVEPDSSIIPTLTKNRDINNANFTIVHGYISDKTKTFVDNGYGSTMDESPDTNKDPLQITYSDFKKRYPFKFNVLVADCEGCLGEFLEMIGDDIYNYNKILFEGDQPHKCNYEEILKKLTSIGFEIVKKKFQDIDRYVLIKK